MYNLINHIVNYLKFCWNYFLTLESVGITFQAGSSFVGIDFRSNRDFYDSNTLIIFDYQHDKYISCHLLECWSVGTKNNTPGK